MLVAEHAMEAGMLAAGPMREDKEEEEKGEGMEEEGVLLNRRVGTSTGACAAVGYARGAQVLALWSKHLGG